MTATIQVEVTRTIREFYYDREEGCNRYRDLEAFEERLMKDAADISRMCSSLIGDAKRNPAMDADSVERIERLAHRTEARELSEALASYKSAREEFYNEADDEALEVEAVVAAAMQEAAE